MEAAEAAPTAAADLEVLLHRRRLVEDRLAESLRRPCRTFPITSSSVWPNGMAVLPRVSHQPRRMGKSMTNRPSEVQRDSH